MPWAGADWQDDETNQDNELSCPHCGAGFDQPWPRTTDPAFLECAWTALTMPPYEG